MSNDDFNWDEVLVTTKPDSKEVEVSFKRVDGGGFFQNESGPGTPPGTTEDPDGCRNTVTLFSEDVFLFQSNSPHYVWLILKNPPQEYMEVDLQFTDGDMTYPDYTTQTLTYVFQPGSWENDGNGFFGKKVPLLTGDLSAKIAEGTDSGLYYGQITAVRNFGADSCFSASPVTINFGPVASESDPPEEEPGGGDPIDPVAPDPDCEPGSDCVSRWSRTENFTGNYKSAYFMREAYTASAIGSFDGYFANGTNVANNSGRDANQFEVYDQTLTTLLFDGNDTSDLPDLELNTSTYVPVLAGSPHSGGDNANPVARVGSHTNFGTTVGNQEYGSTADMYFMHFEMPTGDTATCDNQYFCAPPWEGGRDWGLLDTTRINTGVWPTMVNVVDPTNVDPSAYEPSGTEYTVVQWFSVFLTGPYIANRGVNYAHKPTSLNISDSSYANIDAIASDGSRCYVHNGLFGGNNYQTDTFGHLTKVSARSFGEFYYLGSAGNGGQNTYLSPFRLPDRDKAGWYTVRLETYHKSEYKDNNDDDDFGLYDFGVVQYNQRFATWYFNGQQVTPKHLISDFTRPSGYNPADGTVEQQTLNGVDFSQNNYMRGGLPMWSFSHAEATWVTHAVSYGSRYLPGFGTGDTTKVGIPNNVGGIGNVQQTSGYVVPMTAYVDHSDIANQFFETDQFKTMRQTFDKVIPAYCARRP